MSSVPGPTAGLGAPPGAPCGSAGSWDVPAGRGSLRGWILTNPFQGLVKWGRVERGLGGSECNV